MHRRGAGVGAIKNKNLTQARYKDKGSEIASEQLGQLSKQLEVFRSNLEEFAAAHKDQIRKNPQFRVQFQEMCACIGVDPLASGKGFWSEILGVGEFYYELAVQIVEVCLSTSHRNGGIMGLDELRTRVMTSRGRKSQEISLNDLIAAIKTLRILGNGFMLIPCGSGRYLVQSIPGEFSMDHSTVLQQAETTGFVTCSQLMKALKWEEERTSKALEDMVKESLAWVDDQPSQERQYWFPGLFAAAALATS